MFLPQSKPLYDTHKMHTHLMSVSAPLSKVRADIRTSRRIAGPVHERGKAEFIRWPLAKAKMISGRAIGPEGSKYLFD